MIGVTASPADLEMAEEFFELFKTPWEPAVHGRRYQVLLSRTDASTTSMPDCSWSTGRPRTRPIARPESLWPGWMVRLTSPGERRPSRSTARSRSSPGAPAQACWRQVGAASTIAHDRATGAVWRIGYDLFKEVRYLLSEGQPASQAPTPTLELHIALLRHVLSSRGCRSSRFRRGRTGTTSSAA